MTSGSLVLGLLNGLTIGFLAVGLVLIFRSHRFLNLAHAQLGTLSALLLGKFVISLHWPWFVAFAVAIVVGALTGAAVDWLVVRRLKARGASAITLLLATIGIAQLMQGLDIVPAFQPNPNTAPVYPSPFQAHVSIGGVILGGSDLLVLILVPVLIVALAAFLKLSIVGKTIRAAATNEDAARLCGVPTARLGTVIWAIAGIISAVSAILQAPATGFNGIGAQGTTLLLLSIGAAAAGGFTSILGALGGGIVLGVVEQLTLAATSNAGTSELVVFVVILGIILVRGNAIKAASAGGGAITRDRRPVRIPPAIADRAIVARRPVWSSMTLIALGLVIPVFPFMRTEGHRFELCLIVIYALVGVSLTVLLGWGGQVSLGHFALLGLGAFVAARLIPHGWSFPVLLVCAGACGAAMMVLIGLPALRVPGFALAGTTLGLAVVGPDWLFRQSWLGSTAGVVVNRARIADGVGAPASQLGVYYSALVVLVLVILGARALRASGPGRTAIAVRDNERAAAAFGLSPAAQKLGVLAISGFIAAMAGVLWAESWQSVSASQFSAQLNLTMLSVVVIGGVGSIGGAVAGAAILFGATYYLSPLLGSVFGNFGAALGFELAFGGLGLILVLLAYPTGLAGAADRLWERFTTYLAGEYEKRADIPDDDLLVVDEVSLAFGGLRALDGAAIKVTAGEIVGLIGPNGAGKTTLLNVISGTISPQSGAVRLMGKDVTRLAPELRAGLGLGRSFQDAALFPGLTVKETVQVAMSTSTRIGILGALLRAPWARAAEHRTQSTASQIIAKLGLSAWSGALTDELSTGTRRICELAAQVACGPQLLLLDEPTAGVAQKEAEAFGPLLQRIREDLDCSILIIEHDMPLLMGLCDRIYALEAGRVIAEGTPEQVRSDPAVIASYLGTDDVAIDRSRRQPPANAKNGSAPPEPVGRATSATRTPRAKAAAKTPSTGRAIASARAATKEARPAAKARRATTKDLSPTAATKSNNGSKR